MRRRPSRSDVGEFAISLGDADLDADTTTRPVRLSESSLTDVASVDDLQKEEQFAEPESRVVFWLKLFLIVLLVSSAISVACGVYFYTSKAQISAFETRFADDATKVVEGLRSSIEMSLGAVEILVLSMVSYAADSKSNWPFVTVPHFAIKASKTLSLSNAVFINIYPLVTEQQRTEWEAYSVEHDGWVDQGIKVQSEDPFYTGPIIENYTVWGQIHDYTGPINRTGPYLPIWQSAPVIPRYPPYNWDLRSSTDLRSIDQTMERHEVVISEAYLLPDLEDEAAVLENSYFVDFFSDFVSPGEDPSEPVSDWYYPILDNVDQVYIQNAERELFVGILAMSMYWRDMLKETLPHGSNGIVVVFENSCNPTFTYQINGPDPIYLGRGDRHDEHYDDLKISVPILNTNRTRTARSYTGVPVDTTYCPFEIHLYPSDTMKRNFVSSAPAFFATIAVMIFAFTSAVFLIYDRIVEKRQRKILTTAMTSTQHVSMLERKVKERTRKLESMNTRLEGANRRVLQASAAQLQHFACMSHEIRTPLNCIIGLSSLLEESELTPMQKDSIRMIVHSGDLLLRVVDDVLDYSKLESGNVEVEIRRTNLQETLDSVVHLIETKARSKKLSLRTRYDPNIAEYISTDCRRLQQILYNLLGNALKFSNDGGVLELTVALIKAADRKDSVNRYRPFTGGDLDDSNHVTDTYDPDQQLICFVVKDYGKGISEKDLKRIFKPFSQASASTERLYGGTGLGLSIVSRLVRALGGSISVESEEGQFTEFAVELPFNEPVVDTSKMAESFTHTRVYIVGKTYVDIHQITSTFEVFNIDSHTATSLHELAEMIDERRQGNNESKEANVQVSVCLIDEDLYQKDIIDQLVTKSDPKKTIILTYGDKYRVTNAQGHYRSLVQMMPSVLVERIAAHVEAAVRGAPRDFVRQMSKVVANSLTYKKWRILIAEDNIVNQKVLQRILVRLGVENIEIVENGKLAVEKEASEQFDIVLMDMQMPIMDGVEACSMICKRTGGHPRAKVIFCTAHVSDSFESECRMAGAVGYLAKPCNVRVVEKCLQKVADDQFGVVEEG